MLFAGPDLSIRQNEYLQYKPDDATIHQKVLYTNHDIFNIEIS